MPARRIALAACVVAAGLCPGLARAATSNPVAVLSNETTHSTWTLADSQAPIRSAPSAHAKVLGRLRYETPDTFGLQPYLLLRETRNSSGNWVQLRIPGRPNGRIGWTLRGALDVFHHTNMEIVVDVKATRLTLYRSGRPIFSARVGTGKPSTPTPTGHFWITESFASHDPFYGPWLFGTSDFSVLTDWPGGGVVGIHGTNEPQLVPGHPSHGCIRMHNGDDLTLLHLLSKLALGIGTPILVK